MRVSIEELREKLKTFEAQKFGERFDFRPRESSASESTQLKVSMGSNPSTGSSESDQPEVGINELIGPGMTRFAVRAIESHLNFYPRHRIAWVEDLLSIYPVAIAQRKVPLNQLIFVEAGDRIAWATLQLVKSAVFQIVCVSLHRFSAQGFSSGNPNRPMFTEVHWRQIQLAAEKSNVTVMVQSSPQMAIRYAAKKIHLNLIESVNTNVATTSTMPLVRVSALI